MSKIEERRSFSSLIPTMTIEVRSKVGRAFAECEDVALQYYEVVTKILSKFVVMKILSMIYRSFTDNVRRV